MERIIQKVFPESRFQRAWPLNGGISAQVTAVEIEMPSGASRRVVVRQHGETDLRQNPHIARDEFALLKLLKTQGLPVPEPYSLDESGSILPGPYIVLEYVEGNTELSRPLTDDDVTQVATCLAAIHQVDCTKADFSFLPEYESRCGNEIHERPPVLDPSMSEPEIREVLAAMWPPTCRNKRVLLHGDFWPGNILWRDGQIAAVIDWEDAAVGDPLADVANARLEILWHSGADAMEAFTAQYRLRTDLDFSDLPLWDLVAALRPAGKISGWGLSDDVLDRMREQHRWFVSQAIRSGVRP